MLHHKSYSEQLTTFDPPNLMMSIKIFPIPAFDDNYIWILHNDEYAVVVDPGSSAPVDQYLAAHNLTLTHILITHHHWDHVNGLESLQADWGCQVFAPKDDRIPGDLAYVQEHDSIQLPELDINFKVIETPGHTLSHICYFNDAWLFCGDTLFSIGCGRMFEGQPAQYLNSLEKIRKLPPNLQVYCTHEYTLSNLEFALHIEPENQGLQKLKKTVTAKRKMNQPSLPVLLQQELCLNPFLRTNDPELKNALNQYLNKTITSPIDCFADLRQAKDQF